MSSLEEQFAQQLTIFKAVNYEREYRFDKKRRWRFDFAWPEHHIAVEVDGLVHGNPVAIAGKYYSRFGRHQTPKGREGDNEKNNAATAQGWKVYRVSRGGLSKMEFVYFLTQSEPQLFRKP